MHDITLKYGQEQLDFSLPDGVVIPELREPEYAIDRDDFVRDLLHWLPDDPVRYRRVAIVVSDKTRLCGYPEFLPWVVDALAVRGARSENLTFYIAYGTHARQTESESELAYGAVYHKFRFIHHDCRDDQVFETLGTTIRGTPITIRKDIQASSLILTFGAISHHYFAGYGGGRKMLFPGLASRAAVYHNHSLFLDKVIHSLAPGCQPGQLEGNPLAEDLREIDTHMPSKISIHGILDSSGRVCRLMTGTSYADFLAACSVHDSYFRYPSDRQYDLVVASSGGYPKDINFIQAHKSVHHAAALVKDGGHLVVLSECRDKIGSDYFMKYLEAGSFETAFSILDKNYEGNGGTALSMMLKTRRIHIHMLTSLDEATCQVLGVKKISAAGIQAMIVAEKGNLAVIRNASMLVPVHG